MNITRSGLPICQACDDKLMADDSHLKEGEVEEITLCDDCCISMTDYLEKAELIPWEDIDIDDSSGNMN